MVTTVPQISHEILGQIFIYCLPDNQVVYPNKASAPLLLCFFFSSRRRHTRSLCDWSSDVCSSDLLRSSTTNTKTSSCSNTCTTRRSRRRSPSDAADRADRRRGKQRRHRRWRKAALASARRHASFPPRDRRLAGHHGPQD